MSQYQPIPYTNLLPGPQRPTVVLVIAILVLIFAALMLLCSPFQVIGLVVKVDGQPNPAVDAIRDSKMLTAMTVIQVVVAVALAIAQIVASISAIRMKRWARAGMVNLAIFELVFLVVGTLLYFLLTYPEISRLAGDNPQFQALLPAVMIGTIGGMVFRAALPVITIILFRKKNVIDAFENPTVPVSPLPQPPVQ